MAAARTLKKVLIINKFGPTSNAITGETARGLADYLHDSGCEVSFLCIGAVYRANKQDSTNTVNYRIKSIRPYYNGDSSILRLIMSFVDGFRLFMHSRRIKSDVSIVMTDPPMLFFWFQLFRRFTQRKLVYWTMDLYPDAFVAGKFVKTKNLFYRILTSIVYKKPPDLLIALGNEQRKFLEERFAAAMPYAIIPCGIVDRNLNGIAGKGAEENGHILFGYGGNIGAAHDPEFLIELIKQLDPAKHRIILSLYGTKSEYVKEAVPVRELIAYKKFLDHTDISAIDINIASLLPEWNHICVPSKAVTAICCGSTLLLNAPKTADAWNMFEEASWIVEPEQDYKQQISRFLKDLSLEDIRKKKLAARKVAAQCVSDKADAYHDILVFIEGQK